MGNVNRFAEENFALILTVTQKPWTDEKYMVNVKGRCEDIETRLPCIQILWIDIFKKEYL